MKFYEMEFFADGVGVYTTAPYDNIDAVLDEVLVRRDLILEGISSQTECFEFDEKRPDSPGNEDAIRAFDYWLSDLALAGFCHTNVDDPIRDVIVEFRHKEVRSRFVPEESRDIHTMLTYSHAI